MSGKYGEPWENGGQEGRWVMYDDSAAHVFSNLTPTPRQWEQMRRARLAVNACTGLSDESLEAGVVDMLAMGTRVILTTSDAEQFTAAMKLLRDADELLSESSQ